MALGGPGWPWQHPLAPTAVEFTYPVMPVMGSLTTDLHATLARGCTQATQEPQVGHS